MEILKHLTKKLEIGGNKALLSQKVSEWKHCFEAPETIAKTASFCDPKSKRACITLCKPVEGCECGCRDVRQAVQEEIERLGIGLTVGDLKTGCGGSCQSGPIMGFPQKQFFYVGITAADVPRIFEQTIIRGKLLFPLLSLDPERSYRSDIFYDKHSGLLAGIDDKVCMVDVARYFLTFEDNLSCGKCVPCRIGMRRALECVTRIAKGEGTEDDMEQMKVLCTIMEQTPNCAFAYTSIKPLQSAIAYFEGEFREHLDRKLCAAGVCKELVEHQRKLAVRERLAQTT